MYTHCSKKFKFNYVTKKKNISSARHGAKLVELGIGQDFRNQCLGAVSRNSLFGEF
jgi:hypothetical protein